MRGRDGEREGERKGEGEGEGEHHYIYPGIQKLLANLKPHESTGPDLKLPTVFKELSHEFSPFSKLYLTSHFKLARFRMSGRKLTLPQFSKKKRRQTQSQQLPSRFTDVHHRKVYGA